jgi:predicted subunit of tRNA(5-methylaminomethyl-2-thiouridylate) methyltransferase
MDKNNKILLLYSGGLDSRLVAKILKDRGYEMTAAFFRLPFASDKAVNDDFLDKLEIPLQVFDCTQGDLLDDYLEILRKPAYGRGAGYNPCIDCKLFMTEKLADYAADKGFSAIATGEVPGQRPMSQTSGKMKIIRERSRLELVRPLEELGIEGRSRKEQIKLAKEYQIDYPSPGGGCLLCEKELKERFAVLIENNFIDDETLPLAKTGRHFFFPEEKTWFVAGRNKEENDIIEEFEQVIISGKGKPAVYYKSLQKKQEAKETAQRIQKAYETKNQEMIKYYGQWKV